MSRHRVSPYPFLSSNHTTQLHYTNSYTTGAQITLLRGKRISLPSTAGHNEASLLVQRRTMYFALRLFVYTECCRPGCQCFSVLRTCKSDVILTKWATVVGEVTSPSSDTMCHSCAPMSYTYRHPNLNFLPYTIQILIPHVMWSAQVVRDSKIDHT